MELIRRWFRFRTQPKGSLYRCCVHCAGVSFHEEDTHYAPCLEPRCHEGSDLA